MKMKMVTKYVAFDGVEFLSEVECKNYEAKLSHVRIVGLSIEAVEAALSGADAGLADAIELLGAKLARARRDRGELKRGGRAPAELPVPKPDAEMGEPQAGVSTSEAA